MRAEWGLRGTETSRRGTGELLDVEVECCDNLYSLFGARHYVIDSIVAAADLRRLDSSPQLLLAQTGTALHSCTAAHIPPSSIFLSIEVCICCLFGLDEAHSHLSAKKMKQTWIENKKIKSKWKAEKRKEGLQSGQVAVTQEDPERIEEDDAASLSVETSGDEEEAVVEGADDESDENEEELPAPVKTPVEPPKKSRRKRKEESEATKEPFTLRDLTRQAYSRDSLHSFKADPLHRRRGRGNARGYASRTGTEPRGMSSRGRGRGGMQDGRGSLRGQGEDRRRNRGGGQPNMKLRMDAML
ncbi:hypothetical protein PLICRDRAFT_41779, partial [Plicaturopsis crispa FD-325 SS-3]